MCHHQQTSLRGIFNDQLSLAAYIFLAQHHGIGAGQYFVRTLPLATLHCAISIPGSHPSLRRHADEGITERIDQVRITFLCHWPYVDKARFPTRWH